MSSHSPEGFVQFTRSAGYRVAETLVGTSVLYDCVMPVYWNHEYPRHHAVLARPFQDINIHYDTKPHRGISSIDAASSRFMEQEAKRLMSLLATCDHIPESERLWYIAQLRSNILFSTSNLIQESRYTVSQLTERYPGAQHHNTRYTKRGVTHPYSRKNQRPDWTKEYE